MVRSNGGERRGKGGGRGGAEERVGRGGRILVVESG